MSDQRKPICRLSVRKDKQSYHVLTVWPGKFSGLYDINRDKGSDKYPAMGLAEALRAWANGEAYLQLSWESQRDQRGGGGGQRDQNFGTHDGDQDDIPF